MVRWLSHGQGVDPAAQAAAVQAQFPISEVKVVIPTTPEGWEDLVEPLADIIGRGDIPTEIDTAKFAIMNLKNRASNRFGSIMTRIAKQGALESVIKRIETPVPSAVPLQSIWWREICQSRLSDLQILSIFCHSLDLIAAVRPFRSAILKAMKFLLSSSQFQHIYSIRYIAVEIIVSMAILAPDFDTFVFLHQEGLFQVLCDFLSSPWSEDDERNEWVVYDLGSPESPLCVQSICINIFAYIMSECNVISRSKNPFPEAKSMLAEIESLPIFMKAVDAIRMHKDFASPKYIADALRHLTLLYIFGGRVQCTQKENLGWVDSAVELFSEIPAIVSASFEQPDEDTNAFIERIRSECNFLITLIRERHEPNRIVNRARLPDLRQKFRGASGNGHQTPASPPVSPGAAIQAPSQKSSCRTCGSESNLKRCQRCLSVQYCSRECQVSDWKEHKITCNKR